MRPDRKPNYHVTRARVREGPRLAVQLELDIPRGM